MNTVDMSWLDKLSDAIPTMDLEQTMKEYIIFDACPWCRVGLEHTREEHYSVKPVSV